MATSRRTVLLLAVTLLTGGGALACSQPSAPEPRSTAEVRASPTLRPYIATALAREAELDALREDNLFCTVGLPESWRSALAQGKVGLPDTEYFYPKAVAPDGSQVFGALYSDAWSGVVAVDRHGSITRIRAFNNPNVDQARASFDGRWLVWEESHSLRDFNNWDIRAWDSRTGEVFDIATAPRVNGATVPGPFVIPKVSQGRAAWVQANQSGKGEVHLYDLAERRDQVLSAGKAVPPVAFWGAALLWVDSDIPGEQGHLAMADAATGEPLAVPQPLASIRHIATLAASEHLVAWSEDYFSVYVWRVGEPKLERIFRVGPDDGVDWITIAGDLVEWIGLKGPMVADLRSGSAAPLAEGNGFAYTNDEALVLSKPLGPLVKSGDEHHLSLNRSEIHVVDVTRLPPLPECPS